MSAPASTNPDPADRRGSGRRNLLIVVIAAVLVAGVAGGGYGLSYILLGPSAPVAVGSLPPVIPSGAGVTLPPADQSAAGSTGASGSAPVAGALDGTSNVNTTLGSISDGTASFAGYRVTSHSKALPSP